MLNNNYDFEILSYISKFNQIDETQLLKTFQAEHFAINGRLNFLKSEKLIDKFPKLKFLGAENKPDYYIITETGKKMYSGLYFK